jgi:general secretion pathway protein J
MRKVSSKVRQQQGFTLIELLIAITLMAVMAGLGWRGLDGLMRSRDINQARIDQTAVVQTVLAQWRSDLERMTPVPGISDAGLAWDGQNLRITRRATTQLDDGSDAGLWVVAWTRRDGLWWRWQSPAMRDKRSVQEAWQRAERWGKNASAEDKNWETPLVAIDEWQIRFFRGNAWTNPMSSAGVNASASNSSGAVASQTANGASGTAPDAVRLEINLSPTPSRQAQHGRITLDWMRPNFSNNKT